MTHTRLLSCLMLACAPLLTSCAKEAATAENHEVSTPVDIATVDGHAPGVTATQMDAAAVDEALDPTMRPEREPDVIYVPTPEPVVDAMLKLARVDGNDVLYDLGSGDGRIPIAATKQHGIRAVGIDIDPVRIKEARANAERERVTDKVTFLQQDLFQSDISEATVVTLYLLQSLNIKLRPKLISELKPGTRIVSHSFDMGNEWAPEQTQTIDGRMIYLWTVPER